MKVDIQMNEGPLVYTNTFSVQYQNYITLKKLLDNNTLEPLDSRFVQKYRKDLEQLIFVFRVCYQGQRWKLLKRFEELLSFQYNVTKKYGKNIPTFPIRKENQLTELNIASFGQFLDIFIKRAANTGFYDHEVRNFLDILPEKFGHGIIFAQVPLKKLSGGRYNQVTCCKSVRHYFCPCARSWRTRYFTVTDNGIFYTWQKKSFVLKQMLVLSNKFRLYWGIRETGKHLGMYLVSSTRELTLIAKEVSDFVLFVNAVGETIKRSPLAGPQRFDSFAPIRQGCSTKFYVDGQGYFWDMCGDLLQAKKAVYITGWMITPYLQLRRPNSIDDKLSRFDHILQLLSKRGVKIYIVLYQQPQLAINNDSVHVEEYLHKLGNNIKVLRHPKYMVIPFLWSHHEKSVIIDQQAAYMGGLDICYGRWDTSQHSLFNQKGLWQGADFCNFRISDIYTPRNFLMSNLDQRKQPRMPWHDIAVRIHGQTVHDLARHFISYWNFVNSQIDLNEKELLNLSGRQEALINNVKVKDKQSRIMPILTQSNQQESMTRMLEQGKYYQKHLKDSTPLIPGIQEIKNSSKKFFKQLLDEDDQQQCLIVTNPQVDQTGKHTQQLLRSASRWSIGLLQKEQSIHAAYISLIDNAQRFIYIQNQFFICQQNQVVQRLAERINRAFTNKQMFRVVVFIPLLPGFQGDVRETSGAVMRVQLHWEYHTICRSSKSLLSRLKHIPNLHQYLQFYSLRQHGTTKDLTPVTEILYIHSKLMIVDDQKVIVGSANINDRSLLGDRDSELALCVESPVLENTPWGYQVAKDVQNLRMQLYQQHFGVTAKECQNFMDEGLWNMLRMRAKTNTGLYRQIFGCYPDDNMLRYADIQEVRKKSRISDYSHKSKDIIGHVVEVPMKFLQKEDLQLSANQREFFLPSIFFV